MVLTFTPWYFLYDYTAVLAVDSSSSVAEEDPEAPKRYEFKCPFGQSVIP